MRRRDFIKVATVVTATGLGYHTNVAETQKGLTALEQQAIPQQTLGKTGVKVSILDLGITYFDTAPSYNDGQSCRYRRHHRAGTRQLLPGGLRCLRDTLVHG